MVAAVKLKDVYSLGGKVMTKDDMVGGIIDSIHVCHKDPMDCMGSQRVRHDGVTELTD